MSATPRKVSIADEAAPLRAMTTAQLVDHACAQLALAHSNLDSMAGTLLKLMEMAKTDPDAPDGGGAPRAWRNVDSARKALDLARWRIRNGK